MPEKQTLHKPGKDIQYVEFGNIHIQMGTDMAAKIHPYGAWTSSISGRQVAGGSIRLGAPVIGRLGDGAHGIFWVESRPNEGGRCAIVVRSQSGELTELLDADFSARSSVHEYGGGALFAGRGGDVFFINAADQEIFRTTKSGPEKFSIAPDIRFADGDHDPERDIVFAVGERHAGGHDLSPENFIARVSQSGVDKVCTGADFYAAPRISMDGQWLAWLQWDLPRMPWDAAELHVAPLDGDGVPGAGFKVAGGIGQAVFQPEWGPDGQLNYVMERGNWSNLFVHDPETKKGRRITDLAGELLRPLWGLGTRSYSILGDGRIAAVVIRRGEHELVLIDPANDTVQAIPQPHRQLHNPVTAPDGRSVVAIAFDDHVAPAIVRIAMDGASTLVHRPYDLSLEPGDITAGETRVFSWHGREVYGVFYPPRNSQFAGPDGEKPPIILSAHGGPTGAADRGLKLKIQYWTSRGFAYLDVDYRGSTGYGRDYRAALDGQWGVADADDVLMVAGQLVDTGLCDPAGLFISGGSAGGFTVLMALVTGQAFRAGCVSYGVADLSRLLATTHKFEAGYLYGLTGTSPDKTEPEFTERSPLHQAARITSPVLFLQGLDDKVVPPEQSRMMAEVLRDNGIAVKLIEFPGEGHGFRGADTIVRALAAEHKFYADCLGIDIGGDD
jgi:dipeptidyl aminopeptidase/acylaminoacyl peptidase